MPRPPQLSPDNILRFMQIRKDAASAAEIAAGLRLGKRERHALFKMLAKLKKRHAVEELSGGRYRLPNRNATSAGAEREVHSEARAGGGALVAPGSDVLAAR